MKNYLQNEILKLKNHDHVSKKIINDFLTQLNHTQNLIQENNPQNHFCVFFLPIHLVTKSVYLVHHIKANDWIPPGGHIDKDETPIQTVKRECFEELRHELNKEKIKLFDLTIAKINNPKVLCKIHYDLWYIIHTKKINFNFDKGEFYNAKWVNIKKALNLTKIPNYNAIIKKISKEWFQTVPYI